MKFTRRKFLSSSIAGLALPNVIGLLSSCANPEFIQANENIILGGSKFTEANDAQTKFALSIVNLKLEQHKLVPIDFLAHGIILDPLDNHLSVEVMTVLVTHREVTFVFPCGYSYPNDVSVLTSPTRA